MKKIMMVDLGRSVFGQLPFLYFAFLFVQQPFLKLPFCFSFYDPSFSLQETPPKHQSAVMSSTEEDEEDDAPSFVPAKPSGSTFAQPLKPIF